MQVSKNGAVGRELGRRLYWQAEEFCGVGFGHLGNFGGGNAFFFEAGEEQDKTVGVQRVGGLAHVGGEDAVLRADGANGLGVVGDGEGVGAGEAVVDELQVGAERSGLLHLGNGHVDGWKHGVGDDHVGDALSARFAKQHEVFLGGVVAGSHNQVILFDHREDGFGLRQQLAVARDRDVGTGFPFRSFFGEDRGVGVVGRHPDELAVVAGGEGHLLDRDRVHSADGEVEVNTAEGENAGDLLLDEVGHVGGGLEVVLVDDGAHATSSARAWPGRWHRRCCAAWSRAQCGRGCR